MRIFLAVFPPPVVQRAAAATIEALRRRGDGVAWVKPENLHYTLRFVGEVDVGGAGLIDEAARVAAAGCAPFAATLGGVGAFPNAQRARVLWIGMTAGARELVALAEALAAALEARGFERERQAFSPHLTIGRVRDPREDWTPRLAGVSGVDPAHASFRVERLCVVDSRLDPRGSVYTVREAAALGG